jgi:SRSO17 transposase
VVAPFFGRREHRLRARSYLLGLLSGLERKNGWSLAEFAGDTRPDGMQRLLNHAKWDAGRVRDALRAQVAERLGDAGGVLVVDDTGFEKKGRRSAGVQRQYTGTAGKITNCQIGVFCSYVNPDRRRVLLDRGLYLPESWFSGPGRLVDAGVPEHRRFATKPELAWRMIERACDDPLLVFGWVTGDEAYGDNTVLRHRCAGRGVNYVFAVSCDHPLVLGGARTRADAAFASLDQTAWQRVSCGDGAKGRRWYDWAWTDLDQHEGEHEWMLARRSISDPTDLAFYRCAANRPVGLPELVRVAGSRWSVEECFQASKNEAGLDHYQVRKHIAWYRHITLAMVAHAHLAFLAAGPPPAKPTMARLMTSPHRGPTSRDDHVPSTRTGTNLASWSRSPSTRSAACTPISTSPGTHPDTESTGHAGDAATKPAPATATTNDNASSITIRGWSTSLATPEGQIIRPL